MSHKSVGARLNATLSVAIVGALTIVAGFVAAKAGFETATHILLIGGFTLVVSVLKIIAANTEESDV